MKKNVSYISAKLIFICAASFIFSSVACAGDEDPDLRTDEEVINQDDLDDPGDPGNPGDPGDPGDPSDPGDPVDPGDPSDPGDPGDPSDPGEPEDPIIPTEVITCDVQADCASDEACSQGGHCINITGVRDATAPLQADMNQLGESVGVGIPYKLPDNAILQLNDLTGDGVALRITKPVLFDGAGSLISVETDTIAIRIENTAERASLRDMRMDPRSSSGENDSIGIDVRAFGVRLDNILFWRLGTGVRAYSELDGESVNLNNQQWSRLVFRSVHHYSTDIRGQVNHSLMKGLETIGSAGFYDQSDKGNTYLAPTMEGTHSRSMIFDSTTSHNLILGAYVEEGDPLPVSASEYDFHIGGNSIGRVQGPSERLGGHASYLRFSDPDSGLKVTIPGDENSALAWKHPADDVWWSLRYFDDPSMLQWGISVDETELAPFYWTGGEHSDGAGQLDFD